MSEVPLADLSGIVQRVPAIEPALSADIFASIADHRRLGSISLEGIAACLTEPELSDADNAARILAAMNAKLPDSDPRKITREMVDLLLVAQTEVRKAVSVDCMNGENGKGCEECEAACSEFCARLQAMANALESYLPPES